MNPIQSKIEQTAKEYLSYKAIFDREKEEVEKKKESLKDLYIGKDEDYIHNENFTIFGSLSLLQMDIRTLKVKLYNQIQLVKDSLDIPKEILDLVEDYNETYTFAIIGDEKKIIDKKAFETHKNNYIIGEKLLTKIHRK